MGTPYQASVPTVVAHAISDLLTGTDDAAEELRNIIDAHVNVGGAVGEMISDTTLSQFPVLWAALTAGIAAKVADVTIDAEKP